MMFIQINWFIQLTEPAHPVKCWLDYNTMKLPLGGKSYTEKHNKRIAFIILRVFYKATILVMG